MKNITESHTSRVEGSRKRRERKRELSNQLLSPSFQAPTIFFSTPVNFRGVWQLYFKIVGQFLLCIENTESHSGRAEGSQKQGKEKGSSQIN